MSHITTNLPTMKELEQWIFRKLQEEFARAMALVLETMDQHIMLCRCGKTRFRFC